jgi:CRISPR-associated protein Cmr5
LLYDLLSEWLTKPNQPYAGKSDLITGITEENMHSYRLAQAEAQALMDWVKKFANAYMAGD